MSRRQIRRDFRASAGSDGTISRAQLSHCNPCNPNPCGPCDPCKPNPCQPCTPTLAQRVCYLENEVSDLNCTVAELAVRCCEPNYPPNNCNQYPQNDPYYPKAVNPHSGSHQPQQPLQPLQSQPGDQYNSGRGPNYPNYPNYPNHGCGPFPPSMRPPIVFDGYSIVFKQVNVNGVPAAFWFLLPESSTNPDVYRFTWISSSNTYIYEPVNPLNYSQVYPPSVSNALHITYIYQDIPTRGFGLRPYLYLGIATNPHTIIGYEYVPLVFGTIPNTTTEYCYVPLLPNTNVSAPYNRNITLNYNPVFGTTLTTNKYAANSTSIGNITKLPFGIISNDVTDITPEIVTVGASGVGFLLPFDDRPYTVSFGAEVRVNTNVVPDNPPNGANTYIDLITGLPAVARLTLWRVTPTGPVQLTVPGSDVMIPVGSLNVTPVQDPLLPGQDGLYRNNTIPAILPTYTIVPDATTRTIVSISVSEGYSFQRATMILSRQ